MVKDLMFETEMRDIDVVIITVAKLREAVLGNMLTSGPGYDRKWMPTTYELDSILLLSQEAVESGRVIDFGHWPNEVMKRSSGRGGKLFNQGALSQPFDSPWIFLHTWDDPKIDAKYHWEKSGAAYLVNPFPSDDSCEIVEFNGLTVHNRFCLGVGDRVWLKRQEGNVDQYHCNVIPAINRFLERSFAKGTNMGIIQDHMDLYGNDPMQSAANNVLDPFITALLFLNTKGVKSETIYPDAKLNKARLKNKKKPIPPYRKVESDPYVTAIMHRRTTGSGLPTGTHASPVPHVRIGHWREYKTGERTFIRDTLVNVSDEQREQFVATRSHYMFKK